MNTEELIERLEGLAEPDRYVDCWIGYHADLIVDDMSWREKIDRLGIEHALRAATSDQNVWSRILPRYTASLDATIALVEQKLPGWRIELRIGDWPASNPRHVTLWDNDITKRENVFGVSADAATPAIALLIALLRALKEGE